MYARTTKNAFEEMVFDFHFDRTTPTTVRSLLQLHHHMLQATVERGRIDLTKGDLQSFKLAMILKHEEIFQKRNQAQNPLLQETQREALEKEVARLHDELDVMEDIRDFMVEHVAIMADELDKDCDPTQEKNYSYGRQVEIDPLKRAAILGIFTTLLTSKDPTIQGLATAIQTNTLKDMTPEKVQEATKELVRSLHATYQDICSLEDDFSHYLIKPQDKDGGDAAKAAYQKIFPKDRPLSEKQQQLAWTRTLLWDLFTPDAALGKVGGVSYGRSKDGVSVIPYTGSSKPNERSQHGKDLERLTYTCLDYVQNGLSAEQVRAAYITAKEAALKEVVSALRNNKTISLDGTEAGKKFQREFLSFLPEPRPTLSAITDETLISIQKGITANPTTLLAFLNDVVLRDLRQSEFKIISDAQDPPYMVKSYSGSSGTDTGCYALPDKIDKKDARQPGVHGEVIRWLLENEALPRPPQASTSETSTTETPSQGVFLSGGREPYGLLAQHMKGGDCISDVGRLFPGIPPKTIASNLLKKLTTVTYAVFMNPEDQWMMLKREGNAFVEVKYEPSEDPAVLKQRITIFDDVHTRGG